MCKDCEEHRIQRQAAVDLLSGSLPVDRVAELFGNNEELNIVVQEGAKTEEEFKDRARFKNKRII